MQKRKARSFRDYLPEFNGLHFPIQIATSTATRADGSPQSFCGIHISSKGATSQPTPVASVKLPPALNPNFSVSYCKLEAPTSQCPSCSALMWIEEKVQKSNKLAPRYSICCQEGKVRLPLLHPPPEPLKRLLSERSTYVDNFRQKIRVYNSMFSYTSFGARIDDTINRSRGPYDFCISGQNYHRIGSLLPESGAAPRYAQLYFCDPGIEVQNRMGCMSLTNSDVDPDIVRQLIQMLDNSSCVSKAFRMARNWSQMNTASDFSLKLIGQRQVTQRQYNLPAVPEVATLIVGDFGQGNAPRDVYVQSKTMEPQRISELHPLYMALQYPLLFPYGEDGFYEKIPYVTDHTTQTGQRGYVTMREYYCYRLQQRLLEGLTLIQSGRLYHQYIVDAYTAVEEQRLRWIRFNQSELRADLYNNVADAVLQGDTDARTIGKRIILPASFTGSPRYMAQNYQDAMALCRAYGNPSLFITLTANPKWPEMKEMLSHDSGQTSNDRPDLMTRLFKLKLGQLMQDIKIKGIFGPLKAAVYTIEFQKRGLPHAHILIWLKESSKVKAGKDIDAFITAEIPCKQTDPAAYKAVTEHMLHGPCGKNNSSSPCMINGQCSKHFPKPFYVETTLDEEGFSVYRRRNNGVCVKKGSTKLHNGYVVPYNRYLILKYDAHINVEWCNRSRAIKYLFKYINKGPDRATIMIMENNEESESIGSLIKRVIDEIKQYLECRYLSACEAFWRILGFDIHYSWPAVIRLSYHLPGQNLVTVADTQSLANVLEEETNKHSMFTEWFNLNKQEPIARMYTYAELPTKFVWHTNEKKWTIRKSQKPIGRIVYCHPSGGEKYYLRMLLNVVKGATSFEDLRTVNGLLYGSYREACYARGMLNEDTEWTDAIQEAKLWASGKQLRELFVTILLFCEVSSPAKLWDDNWESLSEDILFQKRKDFRFPALELSEHQIQMYCLLRIEEELSRHGKTISEYPGLPIPDQTLIMPMDNRLIREELSYSKSAMATLHGDLFKSLNDEQLVIYHKVVAVVTQKCGGLFFVYGAGGTGKTFLYKTIMARIRSEGKIVLGVASSGIAALLLPGGRTAHSRFVIPLELLEHSTCGITQNSHLAQLIHEVELIIWDEAPMTQRYAFEALNRTLQDIRGIHGESNRTKLFGGIPALLGGDFRQILLVITKGRRQDIVQAAICNSALWDHCEVFRLSQSMRVNEISDDGNIDKNKQEFNSWIRQIGDGTAPAVALGDEDEPTWIEIPNRYLVDPKDNPIQQLIDVVFPDFQQNLANPIYLQERALLTPLNLDADEINNYMFEQLQGEIKTYKSSDEICMASTDVADQQHMYPPEFLNTLEFPGMPPHNLQLKQGLPVMLLRNVNPRQGLCNGTRLIITHLGDWVIEAEIITGTCIGERVLIPRITLSSTQTKWPFIMKRRQFPIKPCLAMTINKSQGQSLKVVGLYLPKPVFSHGQLYVAVSRVTNPMGLKIMVIPGTDQHQNMTKNVVFKEVFNNLLAN